VTTDADYRPYSGSCPRCHSALGLASVRSGGAWYCSSACARGESATAARAAAVPADRLTNRPHRFFGRRAPKELRGSGPRRGATL
jgi:hypothetical protein